MENTELSSWAGLSACDDRPLWDVMVSTYHLPVLAAADELGIFTYLGTTPSTALEVARNFSLSENVTAAMLGTLAGLGLLALRHDQFHLTDTSRTYLLPKGRYYWGAILRLIREPAITFTSIMHSLKTGRRVSQNAEQDMWATHGADAERATAFTRAMHSHSLAPALGVARHGNFHGVERLLDVGGASACFSIELARRYPQLRCTIVDLQVVGKLADDYIKLAGLEDRIHGVALDMFTDVWPADHDAVFFSNIFHDWDAARCQQLADKCHASLPGGGRIFIHEILLDDHQAAPLTPATYSLDMALYTGGKQYSANELQSMLIRAGFSRVEFVHTHGYFWLVTGYKA